MKTIKAKLYQFYPNKKNAAENARRMKEAVREGMAEGFRLFCFPECSITGYTTGNPREAALAVHAPVTEDDRAVSDLVSFAAREDVILSFGFIEKEEEKLFISQVIAGPAGSICYRKTHLGSREEGVFAAGEALPVYRDGEHVIGVCLCWETHIPEIASVCRAQGADILLAPYASGMGGERCEKLWSVHLPARASDNGMYVLACNALKTASGRTGGGLAAYGPKGDLLSGSFGEAETSLSVTLSGPLPREAEKGDMHNISYFDRKKPELYRKWLP